MLPKKKKQERLFKTVGRVRLGMSLKEIVELARLDRQGLLSEEELAALRELTRKNEEAGEKGCGSFAV